MLLFGGKGELKSLKSNTAIVSHGNLSPDSCKSLIDRIDTELQVAASKVVWRDECQSDHRILSFENLVPEIIHELKIPEKIKAVNKYTGRRTKSWYLMANKIEPKPGNKGSGGGWHRDSAFSHQVKFIWYLNDVDEKNGPFQFIPGTNDVSFFENSKCLSQTRFSEVRSIPQSVEGSSGTLLVCDTKCIHRGKPVLSGVRYALTLYTFPTKRGASNNFRKLGFEALVSN